MEEKKIRIIFRRGSLGLKIVIAAMLVLSIAVLLSIWLLKQDTQSEYDALRQSAVKLEQENQRLEDKISDLGTVKSTVQIAMEQLGLVMPDTIIIGVVTAIICTGGCIAGRRLGHRICHNRFEMLGGLVLIGLALKALIFG